MHIEKVQWWLMAKITEGTDSEKGTVYELNIKLEIRKTQIRVRETKAKQFTIGNHTIMSVKISIKYDNV